MTYVAILILMLAAFSLVGWPLVSSSRRARAEAAPASPTDDLVGQRDAAYRAIKELDFEYDLGNLSEGDYRDLRDRYRGHAATILHKLEAAAAEGGAAPAAEAPSGSGLSCPSCDRPTEAGDRYCWSCGTTLVRRCPACNIPVEPADHYCASCGARQGARS